MEPDELTLTIARHLEIDHQYAELVEAWNTERIAEVRSAGRKAGRLLGWKIITHQTAPGDDDCVRVIVILRESPNAEEHERMSERSRLLINEAFPGPLPPAESE